MDVRDVVGSICVFFGGCATGSVGTSAAGYGEVSAWWGFVLAVTLVGTMALWRMLSDVKAMLRGEKRATANPAPSAFLFLIIPPLVGMIFGVLAGAWVGDAGAVILLCGGLGLATGAVVFVLARRGVLVPPDLDD